MPDDQQVQPWPRAFNEKDEIGNKKNVTDLALVFDGIMDFITQLMHVDRRGTTP